MEDNKYQVVYVALTDLKPHSKREYYKTPGPEFVKSIQEEGIRDPIKVQRGTNIIIGGHTRAESAAKAGLTEVPVIYYDFNDKQVEDLLVKDNAERSGDEPDLMKVARSIGFQMELNGINPSGGRPSEESQATGAKTRAEIADMFKMSETKLKETVSLLRLVPELQALVSAGKIKLKAGVFFASLNKEQQLAYYKRIKKEAQQPGYSVKKSDAKAYREACKPKDDNPEAKDKGPDIPNDTDIFADGETVLDLSNMSLSSAASPPEEAAVIDEPTEIGGLAIPSIFTDETAHIIKRVNDRYQMEGVPSVEINAKRAQDIENQSSAMADPQAKVKFKKNIAKGELDRAKATLDRLESEIPAVFSVELFRDPEPELPSELDDLIKRLERMRQKMEALKSQFRHKESV